MSTLALILDPIEKALKKIEAMKFDCWEIIAEGPHRLTTHNLKELKKIKELNSIELTIHAPYSDLNLASLNPEILAETIKQTKESITAAHKLGAKIVTLHPGRLSPYGMFIPKQAWKTNLESIAICADFAKDLDIIIAIENMPKFFGVFGQTPEELLEMIDNINSKNLQLTFDVGHAYIVNPAVIEFIEKIKDFIASIHLHNNDGAQDLHFSLKKGIISYKEILQKFHEINYNGLLIIETRSLDDAIESKAFLEAFSKNYFSS